jgi:hypothetical protein
MFTDKLSSAGRGTTRSHGQHPRLGGGDSQLRENAGSPAPQITQSNSGGGPSSSKIHTSPSKVRSTDRDNTVLTRPPHPFRCARTTQSSSRAKCIASVALHISPTMSQPSTLPPRRPLLSLRAQLPRLISSLAPQVTIHGVHCMS